jgi:hypothetical protein
MPPATDTGLGRFPPTVQGWYEMAASLHSAKVCTGVAHVPSVRNSKSQSPPLPEVDPEVDPEAEPEVEPDTKSFESFITHTHCCP